MWMVSYCDHELLGSAEAMQEQNGAMQCSRQAVASDEQSDGVALAAGVEVEFQRISASSSIGSPVK